MATNSFSLSRSMLTLLCALSVAANLSAQERKQGTPAAQTSKYEEFTGQAGTLIATSWFDLEALDLAGGVKVETKLVHAKSLSTGEAAFGLRFEWQEVGRYSVDTHGAYLDRDEIQSLLKAVNYIIKHRDRMTSSANAYLEVRYKSRGGFGTGFYFDPAKRKGNNYLRLGWRKKLLTGFNWSHLQSRLQSALKKIAAIENPVGQPASPPARR